MPKNLAQWLILSLLFAGFFFMLKSSSMTAYQEMLGNIPSVTKFGASPAIEKALTSYGFLAGIALGFFAFLLSAILGSLLKLFRVPEKFPFVISNIISYASVLVLAIELSFFEEINSALAAGIVAYLAKPLLYASAIVTTLTIVCLVRTIVGKEKTNDTEADNKEAANTEQISAVLILIIAPTLLSGCSLLGSLTEMGCSLEPDGKAKAHCYQEAALQKNDENVCDKAPQGKEFKDTGSNPPKDKCYYMVAENKQDPDICNKIQGGMMSYTAAECQGSVAGNIATDINDKLRPDKEPSAEELAEIQAKMETVNRFYGMMNDIGKTNHDANKALISNLK